MLIFVPKTIGYPVKIDKNSYGTIVSVWAVFAGLLVCLSVFVHNLYILLPIALLLFAFMFFVLWFHRVPAREVPDPSAQAVTSVADGKVVIIRKVFEPECLKQECIQVSVYMDFFDVHSNFWPMTGTVSYYKYHPGHYFLAFLPKASERNEHSSTGIRNAHGEIFFKQIAGTFARRIVCYSREGDRVEKGKQCGIIKFGSRIDVFLPLDAELKVKVGDRARACETVLAVLK